jgi:hypothetical protein
MNNAVQLQHQNSCAEINLAVYDSVAVETLTNVIALVIT